ncbi:conserved hypothetical protein [Methylomarinovum tepidoasis]|uniref:PIN domain-containing protein n=1 Tax=Methylomarinovum tepidoasis TaxID=2840183 RepID=A0AAU9D2N0_9GAMM|nr:PIN domain-containing protein [Methylomarinovum sp. IN45]BCX89244.1 conserved hypothetical protein [Methylomarinovum sp. IN45]
MKRPKAIVDTGPLVAFLDEDDRHHAWSVECFKQLPPPLLTCEAVIAETLHLLRAFPIACDLVYRWIENGLLLPDFSLTEEAASVRSLVQRYRNVPMSLADACLVRMAEQHPDHLIFTLDSDFRIYRKHRNRPLKLLTPDPR